LRRKKRGPLHGRKRRAISICCLEGEGGICNRGRGGWKEIFDRKVLFPSVGKKKRG